MLFKVKVHLETSPETPKEIASKIAEATKCDVVQVVGGTIVLFRINLLLRQKAAEKKKRAKEPQKGYWVKFLKTRLAGSFALYLLQQLF